MIDQKDVKASKGQALYLGTISSPSDHPHALENLDLKYTINDDSKEVMVDSTDENSVNIFEPQKLLSTLIKDYKISWDITQKIFDGRNIRYINLEPKNSGFESGYYLIGIDFDYNLYKIIKIDNENLKSTLRINTLEYNLKLNKDLFKFSKKNYTDYYIDSF